MCTVLFDLDDTLLDFKKCERDALMSTLDELGVAATSRDAERYSEINDMMWKMLERGEITRDRLKTARFERFFSELGVKASARRAREIYEDKLSRRAFMVRGARKLIKQIYNLYDLYIVSNGTAAVQDGRIAKAGIGRYFKGIFISERLGCNKPSPEFFRLCFERIPGFDKRRAIIVGDSPSSDIAGGKNAGIATCRYNPKRLADPDGIEPDFTVFTLGELPAVLKNFFS